MVFVDSSVIISLINTQDSNHQRALEVFHENKNERMVISSAILGEVLTVCSQRYDRKIAVEFVESAMQYAQIIYETAEYVKETFRLFSCITQKNISWVDCYSMVIMKKLQIDKILTFDTDFQKLQK